MDKLETPPMYYIVYSRGYKTFERLNADVFKGSSAAYFLKNYEGAVAVYDTYALKADYIETTYGEDDETGWVMMEESL